MLLSLVADILCFLLVSSAMCAVILAVAPEMMGSENYTLPMLGVLVMDAPAQLFIIFAQVQAYEGGQAVAQLGRFKLADAQCQSDADREELQRLIANWFTERGGGDGDAEDARRVGFHRFEQFVRHTVAPTLVSSRSYYLKMMLSTTVLTFAPFFDMLCSDAFTANHVPGLVCLTILGFAFLVPIKLFIFTRSAGVVLALRKRCGCSAFVSYGVGIILNTFSSIAMVPMFLLSGPNAFFDSSYRLPDDGLDIIGRKALATQVGGVFSAIGVCAIAWLFKL